MRCYAFKEPTKSNVFNSKDCRSNKGKIKAKNVEVKTCENTHGSNDHRD